jgi:hypothetical protein
LQYAIILLQFAIAVKRKNPEAQTARAYQAASIFRHSPVPREHTASLRCGGPAASGLVAVDEEERYQFGLIGL